MTQSLKLGLSRHSTEYSRLPCTVSPAVRGLHVLRRLLTEAKIQTGIDIFPRSVYVVLAGGSGAAVSLYCLHDYCYTALFIDFQDRLFRKKSGPIA